MNNNKKEYKIEGYMSDIYSEWLETNILYIKENKILDKISTVTVRSCRNDYGNVFADYIDNDINIVEINNKIISFTEKSKEGYIEIDEVLNKEGEPIDISDKEEEEGLEILEKRSFTIGVRGYCQSDWIDYYITLKDQKDIKEVEQALGFLSELFTISSTVVELYERETIVKNNTTFKSEWDFVDQETSEKEFASTEELSTILNKRNNTDAKLCTEAEWQI